MTSPQVVVVGLDGATLDLVRPWAASGELPVLQSLMATGATGKLTSTIPSVTPVAWPTIYTGADPGEHGMLGFHRRIDEDYNWRLYNLNDLRRPALWDVAANHELSTATLFVPFTYPARAPRGAMVAGVFGPTKVEPGISDPSDLAGRLAARHGEKTLFGLRQSPGTPAAVVADRLAAGIDAQAAAMCDVIREISPDIVFGVLFDTDRAAHLLWHRSELPCPGADSPLATVYRAADRAIGRILDAAGGSPLVIVCSDHGTHPIHWRVNIDLWLQERGLAKLRSTPSIAGARRLSSEPAHVRALAVAAGMWRRMPDAVRRSVPSSMKARMHRQIAGRPAVQRALIDWDHTAVYAQPIAAESLHLNVRGREPRGLLGPEEVAPVTDRLVSELAAMTAPDGTPLVRDAHRAADLYKGPCASDGPEVIAELATGTLFKLAAIGEREVFSTPEKPDLHREEPRSLGYHQRDGMVVLNGPGVTQGAEVGADARDMFPTILRHLGLPIPRGAQTGIEAAFDALREPTWSELDVAAPDAVSGLTERDERAVEEQLRDLGYLE